MQVVFLEIPRISKNEYGRPEVRLFVFETHLSSNTNNMIVFETPEFQIQVLDIRSLSQYATLCSELQNLEHHYSYSKVTHCPTRLIAFVPIIIYSR